MREFRALVWNIFLKFQIDALNLVPFLYKPLLNKAFML